MNIVYAFFLFNTQVNTCICLQYIQCLLALSEWKLVACFFRSFIYVNTTGDHRYNALEKQGSADIALHCEW